MKKVLTVCFLLLVLALSSQIGKFVSTSVIAGVDDLTTNSKIASMQVKFAEEINKQLPMQIDEATVLQSVTVLGTTLIYNYRLHYDAAAIDKEYFLSEMQTSLSNGVCSTPEMVQVLEAGGKYLYSYLSQDNFNLGKVTFDASSCR